jgi:DNA (cytosine-5)-methyltransferase 1
VSELSVVEICAGAGGQSLGLHLAGFRHEVAVELDPTAAATLRSNFERIHPGDGAASLVRQGDVASDEVWHPGDFKGVSLLAGGVPCPPFSIAGKQLGADDERDLFAWAVELAEHLQPDAVLLENVRGLSTPRFAGYRQAVIDRFAELGYVADWSLLEARDYGVPQLRPRFVLVALRPEDAPYFSWPERTPTDQTVGSTLLDLMGENGWRRATQWADGANDIAPTIVGGSKKHGGADLGPTRAKRAWRALGVNGLGVADHPPWRDDDLPSGPMLTCKMVERLQGWMGPDYEWHFTGRKTAHYRQVGNAFPPPVARAVGESIARALRREGEARGWMAEHKVHDDVYQVLRAQTDVITASRIQKFLGGTLCIEDIEERVNLLSKDFHIESATRAGEPAWKLGEFKAFRGQPDHARHLAFSDSRLRTRIS